MDIKDYTKVLKKYTTLHKYIDGDMMISYYGGYRLKDTDKVIDVLVEGSGYQNMFSLMNFFFYQTFFTILT